MDEVSLVIMAAGLGSRFGAPKQLVSVGPENEIFLDYAIKAAIEEEIKKVVIVTRSALNEQLKKHLARYQQSNLLIEMVNQDTFEPKRKKPWGTGHAVVTALDKTDGPIIVMNADDYYGPTALRQILNGFNAKNPAILAFKLKAVNTFEVHLYKYQEICHQLRFGPSLPLLFQVQRLNSLALVSIPHASRS